MVPRSWSCAIFEWIGYLKQVGRKGLPETNTSTDSVQIGIKFNQIVRSLLNWFRSFDWQVKITHHVFYRSFFRRICPNVLYFILCYGFFVSPLINSHIWRRDRIDVVTNVSQPTCMAIITSLIFYRSYFRRICPNVWCFILCYGSFVSPLINSHIWRLVGQLSPFIVHKMFKLSDFVLSLIKAWTTFFWYATYCGISKMAAIGLESSTWVKIETCSDFSENSVKSFVLS